MKFLLFWIKKIKIHRYLLLQKAGLLPNLVSDEDGRKTEASGSLDTQLTTSYDFPFHENKVDWNYCTKKMTKIDVIHIHTKIIQAYSCTNCYLKNTDNRLIERVKKNGCQEDFPHSISLIIFSLILMTSYISLTFLMRLKLLLRHRGININLQKSEIMVSMLSWTSLRNWFWNTDAEGVIGPILTSVSYYMVCQKPSLFGHGPIFEKIERRLLTWGSTFSSKGEGSTLIQATLSNLPTSINFSLVYYD